MGGLREAGVSEHSAGWKAGAVSPPGVALRAQWELLTMQSLTGCAFAVGNLILSSEQRGLHSQEVLPVSFV